VFVVNKEVKVKKLTIKWEGNEFTSWFQGARFTTHCTEQRVIFSKITSLWQPEAAQATLKPGCYTFPFVWDLPTGVPGNFEDKFADEKEPFLPWILPTGGALPKSLYGDKSHISYVATATIEEENPAKDQIPYSVNLKFPVCETFNPEVHKIAPLTKEVQRTSIFYKSPITLKVTLPYGGYGFLGHALPINIQITNGSNSKMNGLNITFYRTLTLNAKGESFTRRTPILGGVIPNSDVKPQGFYVETCLVNMPPDMETTISLGTLVKRSYELVFEINHIATSTTVTFELFVFEPNNHPFVQNFMKNQEEIKVKYTFQPQSSPAQNPKEQKEEAKKEESKPSLAFSDSGSKEEKVVVAPVKGFGVASDQNSQWRGDMEDEHVIREKYGGHERFYAAVYDGHGGRKAVEYVKENLHSEILKEIQSGKSVVDAIKKGFEEVDVAIKSTKESSGSTAAVAIIAVENGKKILYTANCGDSRVVLKSAKEAKRLTVDHKPTDPDEQKRIQELGGIILSGKVGSILAVTRSFGDSDLTDWIKADPYIQVTELGPEDTHLIIACDGVWDVLSDQEVADYIETNISAKDNAQRIVKYSIEKKTKDNVSVLVITL